MASVTISSIAGGISNSGTISAGGDGIRLGGFASDSLASVIISNFGGGITNSGVISARGGGIVVGGTGSSGGSFTISSFSGNIANTSAIIAATGIHIQNSTTITGAIVDTGTIQASRHGIVVDSASDILASKTAIKITGPTFTGGITNFGVISGSAGIF